MDRELVVRQAQSMEEVLRVFECFADVFAILKTEDSRVKYAGKTFDNGVCFYTCLGDEIMGFVTGYANDVKTKTAYGTLLAIKKEARLLRGMIGIKQGEAFLNYAKEHGMKYLAGEVFDNNLHAKEQYMKLGAEELKRLSDQSSYIRYSIDDLMKKKEALGSSD